jgi:hypothetical protein
MDSSFCMSNLTRPSEFSGARQLDDHVVAADHVVPLEIGFALGQYLLLLDRLWNRPGRVGDEAEQGERSCGVSLPGWPVTTRRRSATLPSRQ